MTYLLKKYGIENCKIHLIEDDLESRESFYIGNINV